MPDLATFSISRVKKEEEGKTSLITTQYPFLPTKSAYSIRFKRGHIKIFPSPILDKSISMANLTSVLVDPSDSVYLLWNNLLRVCLLYTSDAADE